MRARNRPVKIIHPSIHEPRTACLFATDRPAGRAHHPGPKPALSVCDRPTGRGLRSVDEDGAWLCCCCWRSKRLTEEVSEFGDGSRIHKSALSRCKVFCRELTERKSERERERREERELEETATTRLEELQRRRRRRKRTRRKLLLLLHKLSVFLAPEIFFGEGGGGGGSTAAVL